MAVGTEDGRTLDTIAGWAAFAGGVLVVAVLYWAQAVLVPVALAALLAFMLAPVVNGLQRWIGRVPAVLAIVALASVVVGLAGWGLAREASSMADQLPQYRANIRQKIADVRWIGRGGAVERLQQTVEDIRHDIAGSAPTRGTPASPVVVAPQDVAGVAALTEWIGPVLAPLATGAAVVVLVVFMLLERQELRDRLLGLFGSGTLAVTTRALDEAARRVSRYLLMQSLVNLVFGLGVGIGLVAIGVPYAVLWAVLAAILRFIPYVGPWVGAGTPLAVSLAALPGWQPALLVLALFAGLELFTNLVLETYFYAGAAGVSQVALLVAVAFWAWLWGGLGLLLATPLTVCVVVLGKHVPGLQALATLLADEPALDPPIAFYQRLLARDYAEAATLVEAHAARDGAESVFDGLLLPALSYAECDRLEHRLSRDDEDRIVAATRELVHDAAAATRTAASADGGAGAERERVFGIAVEGEADALALEMLDALLDGTAAGIDVAPPRLMPSEVVTLLAQGRHRVACIADLPPSAPSRSRYLVRKIRTALPEVVVVVGRWAPPALADDTVQPLVEAGARAVGRTLLETRADLLRLVPSDRPASAPAAAVRDAS